MPQKLTNEIITAAIDGFESQKTRIDAQIQELRALLSGGPAESTTATAEPAKRKRRKISAAGRARIAAAQRARWAASKKTTEPSVTSEAPKPKRKLSRAGRAAIVAATKKRWALKRAAEAAKTKPAATRRAPARKAAKKKPSAPSSPTVAQAGA
jgi:hypothetical protein